MPLIVATKAHLVINGVAQINTLREFLSPCQLIAEKIGTTKLYEQYGCEPLPLRGDQTRRFLASFAHKRGHFLRDKVPDENWAARRMLKDFCTGALVRNGENIYLHNLKSRFGMKYY
jgi:hypothetical protein